MSTFLAAPSTDECQVAVKHTGTATGSFETFDGVEVYVKYPPSKSTDKIIIFCPDVYGPRYLNNQLLMDFFASNGYLVLGIDYFSGDQLEHLREKEGFVMSNWIGPHRAAADGLRDKAYTAIHKKFAGKYYAAIGYCFGGKDVVDLLSDGRVASGAVCHPAFITEDALKGLKKGAMFFSCAEVDHTFPAEKRHQAEEIVIENKIPYHFQLFGGVTHGFAIRGDPNIENQRWAKEQSASGCLGWFERFSK